MANLNLFPVPNEFTIEGDIFVLMPFQNKHNIDPSLLKEHRPKFCSSSTEMVMSLCEKNILEQTVHNIQLIIHSMFHKENS